MLEVAKAMEIMPCEECRILVLGLSVVSQHFSAFSLLSLIFSLSSQRMYQLHLKENYPSMLSLFRLHRNESKKFREQLSTKELLI